MKVYLLYPQKEWLNPEPYFDEKAIVQDLGLKTLFLAAAKEVVKEDGKVKRIREADLYLEETMKQVVMVPVEAEEILTDAGCFTAEEIGLICHAIEKHSDKEQTDAEFDEILKDADEMQHWLRNPMEEYGFRKDRTQRLAREFGLL